MASNITLIKNTITDEYASIEEAIIYISSLFPENNFLLGLKGQVKNAQHNLNSGLLLQEAYRVELQIFRNRLFYFIESLAKETDLQLLLENIPRKTLEKVLPIATVSGKVVASPQLPGFTENTEGLRTKGPRNADDAKKGINIFISYAHEDYKVKDTLVNTYIEGIKSNTAENLTVWTDQDIKPGSNWNNSIKKQLEAAEVVLFLISNSFIASRYIKETEIKQAMERFKAGKQIIVPLYIEKVAKELMPFSDKQFLPGGTPLKKYRDKNDAWVKIVEGLISIIKDIKAGNTHDYFN